MNKKDLVEKWKPTGFLTNIEENDRIEFSQMLEDIDNFLAIQRNIKGFRSVIPDGIFITIMCRLYKSEHETDYMNIYSIFLSWYDDQDYTKYLYSNNKNGDKELVLDFENFLKKSYKK